jgi:hypothetical protein
MTVKVVNQQGLGPGDKATVTGTGTDALQESEDADKRAGYVL